MDILIKSTLGGLTIASILLSARYLSPTVAGTLTAVPIIFTFSFFAGFYLQNNKIQQDYLLSVFFSALLTAGLIGLLFLLIKTYPEKLNLNLILGFGLYFLAILIYNYVFK